MSDPCILDDCCDWMVYRAGRQLLETAFLFDSLSAILCVDFRSLSLLNLALCSKREVNKKILKLPEIEQKVRLD